MSKKLAKKLSSPQPVKAGTSKPGRVGPMGRLAGGPKAPAASRPVPRRGAAALAVQERAPQATDGAADTVSDAVLEAEAGTDTLELGDEIISSLRFGADLGVNVVDGPRSLAERTAEHGTRVAGEADLVGEAAPEVEASGGEGEEEEVAALETAAEAEAAAGDEEAGNADERRQAEQEARTEEPANFLAMYFKDMARLSVLRPEEEFQAAKAIEEVDAKLWEAIFAYPAAVEHMGKVVERSLDRSLPELRLLKRVAADYRKAPTRPSEERLKQAGAKAAQKLRAIDIDKDHLEVVLGELRTIERGSAGRVVEDRLTFSPKTKAFQRYVAEVARVRSRAQFAKNAFVKANLRLVVSIARRFNHGRMPLPDLIQEGNIGLIKAVERFDYRRGYRFSTYASWWIRHAIRRALADKGRAVRLPVHMIDAYHRVAKSKRELSGKLGRQPTTDEIGEATGIASVKIEKMRSYLLDQSFSLDRPISDDDGRKFIDFIQDPHAEEHEPSGKLADQAMNSEVRKLLGHLKPIEADILRQRFGLDDDRELTLKEIGEKYNLSRERIRQLQEQALLKMRRALQRMDLL